MSSSSQVLELFFLAGDLEQRAPPDMKEDANRLLNGLALWLDDLDNAEDEKPPPTREDLILMGSASTKPQVHGENPVFIEPHWESVGWKPEYEKPWNMEKDICFQMRDWLSYDHLDKMRLDGTYRPRNVAEIEETWKELFPEQEWAEPECEDEG